MLKEKNNVKEFVTEAFDYLDNLREVSENLSVNRYLLEYIANGFVKYETAEGFIENVDEWLRMVAGIYKEIGFDHNTHQIKAVVELIDQLVVIDDELCDALESIIKIQSKYGLLIDFSSKKKNIQQRTTLSRFFEYIETMYPKIDDRYKGLGSADGKVSREVIMNPATRRIIRVTANDVDTMMKMGVLIGDGKANTKARKEMLMNFRFNKNMIDN